MPFIHVQVSTPLSKEKETGLKCLLGDAITILPHKTERYLMLRFSGECHMYFAGDKTRPVAMVDVSIFGKTEPAALEEFTQRVCDIMEDELAIPPDRVYVKYTECDRWGFNGANF